LPCSLALFRAGIKTAISTAIKVKPYWGNHFWAPGYCVDTVDLDEEKIRRYVQYQERREKHEEQGKLFE